MSDQSKTQPKMDVGTVTLITRRMVTLRSDDGTEYVGKTRSRSLETVVGDRVKFSVENSEAIVTEIVPRKNLLRRVAEERQKQLVANLDLLCIVTAPLPLLNARIIDRIIAAAFMEEIPVLLILNKIDKNLDGTTEIIEVYKKIGIECFEISAKFETNLAPLFDKISNRSIKNVALCGVSGVGKSSLLKRIIPGVEVTTDEVSEKTGQGKQTTSQAIGYPKAIYNHLQYIIDLPGVQRFGLHHIPISELYRGWIEIQKASSECKFRNCLHEQEPDCNVRKLVKNEQIAAFRYEHYLEVLAELKSAKPY